MDTQDKIDWSCLHPQWKWMARDAGGFVGVYRERPNLMYKGSPGAHWQSGSGCMGVSGLIASYVQGPLEYQDSLVERPK